MAGSRNKIWNFLILLVLLLASYYLVFHIQAKQISGEIIPFKLSFDNINIIESKELVTSNSFKVKYFNGKIFHCENEFIAENNKVYITLNIIGEKSIKKKLYIDEKDFYPHITNRSFEFDLLFWNNKLYVLGQFYVYIFAFDNYLEDFKYLGKTAFIKFGHNRINKTQDSVIMYNCNIHSGLYGTPETNTYYTKFDTSNYNLANTVYLDDPKDIEWSYIRPREMISTFNQYIAVTEALKYHIKIYKNNELVYTIFDSTFSNKNLNVKLDKSKNIKISLIELSEKRFETNLIRRVDFLSDDTLMVLKAIPNNNNDIKIINFFFDIWVKNNNKWELTRKNIKIYSIDDYEPNDFLDMNFMFNPYEISFDNGYIITMLDNYPFSIDKLQSFTKDSYLKNLNNYLIKNDILYKYLIYKIK